MIPLIGYLISVLLCYAYFTFVKREDVNSVIGHCVAFSLGFWVMIGLLSLVK